MNRDKTLSGPSFLPHKKPQKIIFMLHGYGDTAENFIHISSILNQTYWNANFIALNAPSTIINYPSGRQWFDLYPNGIYIADAGPDELKLIKNNILETSKLIENTILRTIDFYNLRFQDCILLGFSQGGMMTFEFGNYIQKRLGALVILSGRIISKNIIKNQFLLKTPIFISHGNKDQVLPLKLFNSSCEYLKNNRLLFEAHTLEGDGHIISPNAINLLQKFIKKIL